MTTLHEQPVPEAELATVGDLVQIIAEDVHTANSGDVPAAAQQLDDTLVALIDQRIAKWFKENQRSDNGN